MTALYCIIMADSEKNGLWPAKADTLYDKNVKINGDYTFFQQTFLNIASLIDDKNIITITNDKYTSVVKNQLKILQEKFCRKSEYNVHFNPVSGNTAYSLSVAVKYINDKHSFSSVPPVILAVPANLFIKNREDFFYSIEKGINLAKSGYITAFGSIAEEINEDFSYFKARKISQVSEIESTALKISKFIEKSALKEQKESLKGKIFINSGIYMFNSKTYFSELKKCSPEIYKHVLNNSIKNHENISIENALIEKSKKLTIIPLASDWQEVYSWNELYNVSDKDKDGNCLYGKIRNIDSKNSILYSTSKTIAAIGLKNIIAVETKDAVFVCGRDNADNIKKIIKKITEKKSTIIPASDSGSIPSSKCMFSQSDEEQNTSIPLINKTEYRPWGYYNVLEKGKGFLTKCITVNPNAKLSVQYHHYRSEHWIVLEGEAIVIKGNKTIKLNPGESIDIEAGEIHSIQNLGQEQVKILEVQQGDILDENDIERLEDIYGRV